MGNSFNFSKNQTAQSSVNSVFQSSSSVCNASCSRVVKNSNITVTGSNTGNVGVNQNCKVSALCSMRNNLKTIVGQVLDSVQKAKSAAPGKPSLFSQPGWSLNFSTNILNQSLENSTTQTISSVCNATNDELIENVNITVTNSTVKNVEFNQGQSKTGVDTSVAKCAMDNTASTAITQSETGSQTATSTSGSVIVMIAAIMATVIIIVAIVYLLRGAPKKVTKIGKEKTGDNGTEGSKKAKSSDIAKIAKIALL